MAKKPKESPKPEEPKKKEGRKEYAFTPFGKAKVLFVEADIVTVEYADKSKKTYKESEISYCD